MFGYIYVNEQELKLKEYTAYRSFYCGLCRNLHLRYGRMAQMMLNYDLTFLAILLTGLYEPESETTNHRCLPHPLTRHLHIENEAVSYAADMCVMLSWQKLMDDWKDERNHSRRVMAELMRKDYRELRIKYPRQARALEKNIRLLSEAEQAGRKDIDYVAGLTGKFLEEIFVWKEDEWQDELRTMGFYLGKFIYLMDALEDVKKDQKHGNYNLFSEYGDVWADDKRAEIQELLTGMMAEASRAFERLPVLQYAEIIRNILYSGVWCRYVAMQPETMKTGDEIRRRMGIEAHQKKEKSDLRNPGNRVKKQKFSGKGYSKMKRNGSVSARE